MMFTLMEDDVVVKAGSVDDVVFEFGEEQALWFGFEHALDDGRRDEERGEEGATVHLGGSGASAPETACMRFM